MALLRGTLRRAGRCAVRGRPWQEIPFSKALGIVIKTADKTRADAAPARRGPAADEARDPFCWPR